MTSDIPTAISDPTNAKILAVSEDLVAGFQRKPFHVIAEKSELPLETVIERIRAMQEAVFAAGAERVGTVIKMDDRRDQPAVRMEDKVASARAKM